MNQQAASAKSPRGRECSFPEGAVIKTEGVTIVRLRGGKVRIYSPGAIERLPPKDPQE